MTKRMLIDATHAEETRVAVVDGNRLVEFDYESRVRKQLKGSIFLAKVTRVEPSLQACFVNFGGNRHGFLPFSEIHPDYFRIPIADREALLAEQKAMMEALAAEEAAQDAAEEAALVAAGKLQEVAETPVVTGGVVEVEDDSAAAPEEVGGSVSEVSEASEATVNEIMTEQPSEAVTSFTDAMQEQDNTAEDQSAESEQAEEDTSEDDDSEDDDSEEDSEEDGSDESEEGSEEGADESEEGANAQAEGSEGEANGETQGENGEKSESKNGRGRGRRFRGRRQRGGGGNGSGRRSPMQSRKVEIVGGDSAEGSDMPFRSNLRRNYKIQEVIKRGQIMLVQVQKEERGNKGAAVTTYLSLPGRYCVLMPNSPRGGGVSRKIASFAERKRMREILSELSVPDGMSVILRTAGVARTKVEIKRDLDYLMRLWDEIREQTLQSVAPAVIYEESNLVKRAVRDIYASDIEEILAQGDEGFKEARNFMKMLMPSHVKRVTHYQDEKIPLFHRYQCENQIAEIGEPVVTLRSGGYLVINPTEALVSVDVNSGRATKERHIEETALKTNMEAAEEVARQLRLRDLGGLVVIDFIDMEDYRNNAKVERKLKEALSTDRARIQVGRISSFGLLELSRQRLNPSLTEAQYEKCPHCKGVGNVRTTDSAAITALRALEDEGIRNRADTIYLSVANPVALYILNQKRELLADIERRYEAQVFIRVDDSLAPAGYKIDAVKTPSGDEDDDDSEDGADRTERPERAERPDRQHDRQNGRQNRDRGGRDRNNRGGRDQNRNQPRIVPDDTHTHTHEAADGDIVELEEDDNVGNRADVDSDERSYEGREGQDGSRGPGRDRARRRRGGRNRNRGRERGPQGGDFHGNDSQGNDSVGNEIPVEVHVDEDIGNRTEDPAVAGDDNRGNREHGGRDNNRGGRDRGGRGRDRGGRDRNRGEGRPPRQDGDRAGNTQAPAVAASAAPSRPQFTAKTFGSRRASQPAAEGGSSPAPAVAAIGGGGAPTEQSFASSGGADDNKPKKKGWWNKLIE